jgi:aminopeptidase N
MLRHYIGDKTFRSGLTKYFKTFAYKNTTGHDLWKTLSEASGKDVESFMTAWISQPGFPVVHASQSGNKLSLAQERLTCKTAKQSNVLWPIPLNSTDPELPEIFNSKKIDIIRNNSNILRFNVDSNAHFITHYDQNL